MALLDVVIEFLNINCSVVQCSGYGSEIEALFYLLFFPTVFIILFVYVVVGAVLNRVQGTEGALRLLVSVALYAFIIFEGYYNLFVSLSRLWWLLLATLLGVWLFIRQFIHGGGGFPSLGGGGRGMSGFISDKVKRKITGEEKDLYKEIEDAFKQLEHFYNEINDSTGEAREIASTNFRDQQTRLRSLITDYNKYGKMELSGGVKVNIQHKSREFWKKYDKWSDKYKKIKRKRAA
jgi:hypothetical protein